MQIFNIHRAHQRPALYTLGAADTILPRAACVICKLMDGFAHCAVCFSGDRLLPINRRHLVFKNGTLVIEKLQANQDAGSYMCTASNKQGNSASGVAHINVMGKLP
jgi:hypothetical protein